MLSHSNSSDPSHVSITELEATFVQLCADEKWSDLLAGATFSIEWRLANADKHKLTVCEDKEEDTIAGVMAAANCERSEAEVHGYNVSLAYSYYFRTVAEVSLLKLEESKKSILNYFAIWKRILPYVTSKQLITIAKQQRYIALIWRDYMPEQYQTCAYLYSIAMMKHELLMRKSKTYQAAAADLLNQSYADLLDLYIEKHKHSELASLLNLSQEILMSGYLDKKQLVRIHVYMSTEKNLLLKVADMANLIGFFFTMFTLTETSEKLYGNFKLDAQYILVKLLLLQHCRVKRGIEYEDMPSKEYPVEDNKLLGNYYQDAISTSGTQQFYPVILKLMKIHFAGLCEAHESGNQPYIRSYGSIVQLIGDAFPRAACGDRDLGFLANYKYQIIQIKKLHFTSATDKPAVRILLSESMKFLFYIKHPQQVDLDLLDNVLHKLSLLYKRDDFFTFTVNELQALSADLKAVSVLYHPIILNMIKNTIQQMNMDEYRQNLVRVRASLFSTFLNIVDACENTLADTSEYSAVQKLMKKLGISIGPKDREYNETKQLKEDLIKAAVQSLPQLEEANLLPMSESTAKPSTARHKPKKVYLAIVQQYKEKHPDVEEQELNNLNLYFKAVGEKKEESYQHTEKGFIVNLSEVYRYINKSKPSVFPETDFLSVEDIENCYKGRRIEFDVRNLLSNRYKALLAPKFIENKESESPVSIISAVQSSALPVSQSTPGPSVTEPEENALEAALKLERDKKESRRELNQKLYDKSQAEKLEAKKREQEEALALKQQKEEERKRKSEEFAAKKEQDKKDRIEREKQKVIEEKRIEAEIQNTVTPVQKACLDQVFFSLWQIKQLKSRSLQGEALPGEAKDSDITERPVDPVTRHYALLYQLFRCFQMMKTYKEEFYRNSKLKSKLKLKNPNDIYPGLAKLRNRIIHRGAEVVSSEDMELVSDEIMKMMPQKFTLKPQNGEASCWNATMTETQRKEWVCEFGYCNERYKFTEGQLTLEDTDLYKKLEAFHEDLGEKKIDADEAEKMIAEKFIPKINAIIDAVDNKKLGIVEFQNAHIKQKGVFSHNYFFELQALRMLVTMCGELSGAFAHAKKSEFKSFIEYARSLRNKVGHEIDDVNSEFKLDIAFFSELRAHLYYINNKKSHSSYVMPDTAPAVPAASVSVPVPAAASVRTQGAAKPTSSLNVKAKAFEPAPTVANHPTESMLFAPAAMPLTMPVMMPMYISTPQGFFLNPHYRQTGFYGNPQMNPDPSFIQPYPAQPDHFHEQKRK